MLLQYVGDTPAEQHEVFRAVKLKKWFWPLGFWKYRPSGLHFLWLMKISILQYAIVRPVCTLVAVGLQYFELYCLESWEPYFGHLYISIAISISVTVAMYCLIQFYIPVQEELKPYSPVLKFLAVKSVVFLTFWQDSFLSILVYFGAIKPSEYMSAADIQVGINALLETFEMVIFGFLHIKAFTYLIYRPKDRSRVTRRGRALLDVLDYRDWYYQMSQTSRYMVARSRGRAFTVADDIRRQKYAHLEKALGRDRLHCLQKEEEYGKAAMPSFWKRGCDPIVEGNDASESELEKGDIEHDQINQSLDPELQHLQDHFDVLSNCEGNIEREGMHESEEETQLLPTLPSIDVDELVDSGHETMDTVQTHGGSGGAEIGQCNSFRDDTFVPRKGGKARKEASFGLGAWWRAFHGRASQSRHSDGEPGHDGDDVFVGEQSRMLPQKEEERYRERAEVESGGTVEASHEITQQEADVDMIVQNGNNSRHLSSSAQLLPNPFPFTMSEETNAASNGSLQSRYNTRHTENDATQIASSTSGSQKVSLSTAALLRQEREKKRAPPSFVRTGPKGKQIPVVLPTPLSPDNYPDTPDIEAQIPQTTTTEAAKTPASISSGSRIRFVEVKAPQSPTDDPEMERPKLSGWVVAGNESLSQARARERKIEQLRQSQASASKPFPGSTRAAMNYSAAPYGTKTSIMQGKQRATMPDISRDEQKLHRASDTGRKSLKNEKKIQRDGRIREPYMHLPAPSQSLRRGDPFAVAALGHSSLEVRAARDIAKPPHSSNRTKSSLSGSRDAGLEVGAIVSTRDVAKAMALPPLDSPVRPNTRPRHSSQATREKSVATETFRHPPPLPCPPHFPVQIRSNAYNRYTGEPERISRSLQTPYHPHVSGHVSGNSRRNDDGREVREGFQFDYID